MLLPPPSLSDSISCHIDGHLVSRSEVAPRPTNFEQAVPGKQALRYRVTLPTSALGGFIAGLYDRSMQELLADEPYDDGTDAVVAALRAFRFPPHAEAIDVAPEQVARVLAGPLRQELLAALFPYPAAPAPVFLLNSLESVRIDDETVLEGIAYTAA